MRRSAAEMSGLRSSNSEGNPDGIKGGAAERARSEIRNVEAGCPTKRGKACSNFARWRVTAGELARGFFRNGFAPGAARVDTPSPGPQVLGKLRGFGKNSILAV